MAVIRMESDEGLVREPGMDAALRISPSRPGGGQHQQTRVASIKRSGRRRLKILDAIR